MKRATFLSRVRAAIDRPQGAYLRPLSEETDIPAVRYAAMREDLVEVFSERAERVGVQVHVTGDPEHAVRTICEGATAVLYTREPEVDAVVGPRREGLRWPDCGIDGAAAADVAVTGCVAAVAATGSVVLSTKAANGRAPGLLAPVHVVLVARTRIVATPLEVFRGPAFSGPPSQVVFETGPSRSGDIEGALVRGVHGPKTVHAVLI